MSGNVYDALTEADDPRWAFGSGFSEAGAEIAAPVPDGERACLTCSRPPS